MRALASSRLEPGKTGTKMQDMRTYLEKLRADAAECQLISDLATHPLKRQLFAKLAEHHRTLANEVEGALEQQRAAGGR